MIAEQLIRLNLTSKIIVYDMDEVEEKNLNNQAYLYSHIGKSKVEAMQELAKLIDPTESLRGRVKKVEELTTTDDDIVILAIDSFESRVKILESIKTDPLVISGGISSIGGNIEVTRGSKNCQTLADEYKNTPDTGEYDENDLTPCGSPISIYHRIRVASSIACESLIKYYKETENMLINIVFDVPNLIFITTK